MPNKQTITVIVNGVPKSIEVNIHAPARTIVAKALEGHSGRPPEDWELRDEHGNVLDLDRKIEDYNFTADTKLFLNLTAGVAG